MDGPVATTELITSTPAGLYCAAGDFYIDPWRPVARALITHGHSDHARTGSGCYYTCSEGLPILQWRLGEQDYRVFAFGEPFDLGEARVSFHPAGHVLGSAQVRVEAYGRCWVISGDYKRASDPTCSPFEPVLCDTFITEATFALPVYRWPPIESVVREIVAWRDGCAQNGEVALLYCYALGKAQRVLAELARCTDRPVYTHGAVESGVRVYRAAGIAMPPTLPIGEQPRARDYTGELVIAPPSAAGSAWLRRFRRAQHGFASGWMRIRGNRRRRNMDRGFVISDHADWDDLLHSVDESRATRVIATHGSTDALVQVLKERGLAAGTFTTEFGGEN
jgi:putative mRNA 3-end processing factor